MVEKNILVHSAVPAKVTYITGMLGKQGDKGTSLHATLNQPLMEQEMIYLLWLSRGTKQNNYTANTS